MFQSSVLQKLTILCMPLWLLATPNAPTDLVLGPKINSVEISWTDNSSDETGFKIYRDGVIVGYTQTGVHAYVDSGLEERTQYTYTIKATDDTISTALTSGVEVSATADKDNYKYYTIDALAGDTVTVSLHDMDADGDLYVNIANGASRHSYTCKSKNSDRDDDSCSVTLGSDETVYIAVYAARCINNVQHTITATVINTNNNIYTALTSGIAVSGVADKDNYSYYEIDALAGDTVSINLSDMDADGDLYVNIGESAYKDRFICKSTHTDKEDENCQVTLGLDATVYISVYAYDCINNVQHNITATISNANGVAYGERGSIEVLKEDMDGYTQYIPKDVVNPPVVLLLTGWHETASQFTYLMEFIASQGYYVIGFDDVYYNLTKVKDRLYDIKDVADTSKVAIIGHSTGGSNGLRYLEGLREEGYAKTASAIINMDGYFVTDTTPDQIVSLDTNTLMLVFGGVDGTVSSTHPLYQDVRLNLAVYELLTHAAVANESTAFLIIDADDKHSYPLNGDSFDNYMSKQDLLVPIHKYLNAVLKNDLNAQDILDIDQSDDVSAYIQSDDYHANDYEYGCATTGYDYCSTDDVYQIISNYKKLGEN